MSDGFLKRWSRRKTREEEAEKRPSDPAMRTAESGDGMAPQVGAASPATAGASGAPTAPSLPRAEEPIDPATLPPLESLGIDSDYTVFLRKGVPEPLRIAALRRAWMSDPFIRDFRGPAEYALDYTTSEFDLLPTDNVAEMLDRIFPPQRVDEPAQQEPAQLAENAPQADAVPEPSPPSSAEAAPAPLQDLRSAQPAAPDLAPERRSVAAEASGERLLRRKHGGALPG